MLVERSKRSVRFTAVGEEVAGRARALIRATEDLCAVAQGGRAPLVGPLRLVAIPTVAPFLLPRLLAGVGRDWPRLKLFVREMLTGPACEAVQRGAADCVLLALPAECGEVETAEVAVDPLVLATPAGEGTENGVTGAAVRLDGIDPARLLLLEDGHCLRDHALAACKVAGPAPDAPLVASTLETLVRLVDAGLGITLLPRMGVEAGILAGSAVEEHPIAGDAAERRIVLAWRRGHPRADEFRLLARTIRESVVAPDHVAEPRQAGGGTHPA